MNGENGFSRHFQPLDVALQNRGAKTKAAHKGPLLMRER
jgi:hypothetical protein